MCIRDSPTITYLDSTNNLTYNLNNLMLEESYRRIFPVVRDTNSIMLGGWNIQNSSGTLKFIYNSTTEATLSSAGILICNGLPSINTLSNVSCLLYTSRCV